MIRNIHHINFIFADLEKAITQFESALGLGPFQREEHAERGVRTARARVGDTWLVLVSPTRADSVPGRYLRDHGEGFFLISFGVEDLDGALRTLEAKGISSQTLVVRNGILDWTVADIPIDKTAGIFTQLTGGNG